MKSFVVCRLPSVRFQVTVLITRVCVLHTYQEPAVSITLALQCGIGLGAKFLAGPWVNYPKPQNPTHQTLNPKP